MRISVGVLCFLLSLLGLGIVAAFFLYGLPSLEGKINYQLYADTITYEKIAQNEIELNEIISFSANLIGPPLIFNILGESRIAVFVFNIFVIAVSIVILLHKTTVNRLRFFLLLSTSALFLFSFFGLNKEILLFLLSCLLYRYALSPSWKVLLIAVLLSILIRWQLVIFCVLISTLLNFPFAKRLPKFTLLALTLGVGTSYAILQHSVFSHVDDVARMGAEGVNSSNNSGLFSRMLDIQRSYGYILVVIPKTLQLLIGLAPKLELGATEEGFWNYSVMSLQSIHNAILTIIVFFQRKKLNRNIVMLIISFCIVFSITPIFGPRYFYPVSLWLIFAASQIKLKEKTI